MKIFTSPGILLIMLLSASAIFAQMSQTVPADKAQILQSGPGKLYCPNCGMNLVKFYKTSHALGDDQYCSLHCFCEVNPESNSGMEKTQVVDFTSLKFIPAARAHYVVGSDVKGTMTMTSKYAFADRADAEAFADDHGGEIMSFEAVLAMARKALAQENQMIAKKRQSAAQKGRKIFETMCGDADLPDFSSIAAAKTHLVSNQTCGKLKDEQYQAVAIYLVGRQDADSVGTAKIQVPEKAKCLVCGMYAALYPDCTAEIVTTDGTQLYFDGVKDMMKFYLEPNRYHAALEARQIADLRVSDYYKLKAIDARKAWYVVGSNVFGPMGNELIPFRTEDEAETFSQDHSGDSIVGFDQITKGLVHGLDQ